jgi:type I restriction enzyme R subunit
MERLSRIEDAMNALISPDPLRRDFFAHERLVSTLYRAVKPDPSALEFASRVACLTRWPRPSAPSSTRTRRTSRR